MEVKEKTINIQFKKKQYKIYTHKLIYTLNILSNEKIKDTTEENLLRLMEVFELYDEEFLVEMSKK